jgi:predicted RNA-binding protein YlxR (DUF448 family)
VDRRGRKRHLPQRTCIVCGRKKAKSELLRLVLNSEDEVCLDWRQRCDGRGSYVCLRPECLTRVNLARLQKAFKRRLRKDKWCPDLTMMEALQIHAGWLQKQHILPNTEECSGEIE